MRRFVSREWRLYLDDILSCCDRVLDYTCDLDFEGFVAQRMAYDAVIRNLEIIGEAAKNLPENVRARYPEIEWRRIAGLRDVLAHGYFGLEPGTIWDIVRNKIPLLKIALQKEVGL